MPAEERIGLDEEPPAEPMAKEPTQSGEHRSVTGPQRWSGHLAPEQSYLMTEHRLLR